MRVIYIMDRRCILRRGFLILSAILSTALFSFGADDSRAECQSNPAKIKVLLLPTIDEPRGSRIREQIVRLRQQYQFIARGFTLMGEEMARQAALKEPSIKLTIAAELSPEKMDEMASRTGADWVVSIIIKKVDFEDHITSNNGESQAFTTLQLRVRDERNHTWVADREYTARHKGSGPPPELLLISVWKAAQEALAETLVAYPEVVPVSVDGAIVDYLKNQTQPFAGEPGKLFTGLADQASR